MDRQARGWGFQTKGDPEGDLKEFRSPLRTRGTVEGSPQASYFWDLCPHLPNNQLGGEAIIASFRCRQGVTAASTGIVCSVKWTHLRLLLHTVSSNCSCLVPFSPSTRFPVHHRDHFVHTHHFIEQAQMTEHECFSQYCLLAFDLDYFFLFF